MAKKQVKDEEVIETTEEKPSKKGKGAIYTYVGGGEDSPRVINFMGRQKFVRGEATEVTDQELLKKIVGNPTFVEGEVALEELHEYDEEAKKEAEAQRKKDARTNAAYMKKHNKE